MIKNISTSPILFKNTMAVHSSAMLSLIQRKSINILLKNAFKDRKLVEDIYHELAIKDLMKELGYKKQNRSFNDDLKANLFGLSEINVKWNVLKKDNSFKSIGQSAYLASISIENGIIKYTFSKHMRDIFFKPNLYARLNLDYQKDFSNKYSIPLWELMCEELSTKKSNEVTSRWLEYQKILELFALEESSYIDNYKYFKSQVLNKAIKEINQKSDISIRFEEKKSVGKKVSELRFVAEKKNVLDLSEELSNLVTTSQVELVDDQEGVSDLSENSVILERMSQIVSVKIARYLLKKYDNHTLINALNFCEKYFLSDSKIKNPVAFFKKALEEGWVLPEVIETNIRTVALNIKDEEKGFIDRIDEPEGLKNLRKYLFDTLGSAPYCAWFKETRLKLIDTVLHVSTNTQFQADRIENNYRQHILDGVKALKIDMIDRLEFEVQNDSIDA